MIMFNGLNRVIILVCTLEVGKMTQLALEAQILSLYRCTKDFFKIVSPDECNNYIGEEIGSLIVVCSCDVSVGNSL